MKLLVIMLLVYLFVIAYKYPILVRLRASIQHDCRELARGMRRPRTVCFLQGVVRVKFAFTSVGAAI